MSTWHHVTERFLTLFPFRLLLSMQSLGTRLDWKVRAVHRIVWVICVCQTATQTSLTLLSFYMLSCAACLQVKQTSLSPESLPAAWEQADETKNLHAHGLQWTLRKKVSGSLAMAPWLEPSLMPRPHLLRRQRVWWLLSASWLWRVSSIDCEQATQRHTSVDASQRNIREDIIKIADSPDPFPCGRAGDYHTPDIGFRDSPSTEKATHKCITTV